MSINQELKTASQVVDHMSLSNKKVVCIGGGPAGLTAAYLLSKKGITVEVLEADPEYLGGISKTVSHNGFLCDIGGHRFFSKSEKVNELWREIIGKDFVRRPRKSRIYYKKKFFDYPLKPANALLNLGVVESVLCVLSYAKASLFPVPNPVNFEQWVSNRFGRRLFSIFFKSYTEKVWGMRCTEISADWAAQRIKGLSLMSAIKNAFFSKRSSSGGEVIKTLIDFFHYPRKGPGMMWEKAGEQIKRQGGKILMGHRVISLRRNENGWNIVARSHDGVETLHKADFVISSAPIRELVTIIEPAVPRDVASAAAALSYRDFLVVGLVVRDRNIFDDNWIYIHDPEVKVGRIQNFKSWSPEMVPEPAKNCYGMEYFCFEGDGLWTSPDEDLVELASDELIRLDLAQPGDITDGFVIRQKKAYPVYDDSYAENVNVVRRSIEEAYPGLCLVGRNGMHKYNNQDHAMMTAILTVENIVAGEQIYDVWRVNQDAEYHEEQRDSDEGARLVPEKI